MPRFVVAVDDRFNETLTNLANAHGGTKAEVIRRAVASYQYLKSEVPNARSEGRISITDAEGNVRKDVILP